MEDLIWTLQGEPVDSVVQLREHIKRQMIYGIVYKITFSDNKWIIGKRKVEGAVPYKPKGGNQKRPNHVRFVRKGKNHGTKYLREICHEEYNWQGYHGKNLHTARPVKKEILQIAPSFKALEYLYIKELFKHDALEDSDCLNETISDLYKKEDIHKFHISYKSQLLCW